MKILVVDDEKIKRITLRDDLREANYDAIAVESPAISLKLLDNEHFDVLVTDLRMPKMHGIDFLKQTKREHPHINVIIMTAYATVETAVEAMRFGAHNYIKKPFSSEELISMLDKLKTLHLKDIRTKQNEMQRPHNNIIGPSPFHNIVGKSQQIQEIFSRLSTVTDSSSNVLIYGERGVGKALLARSIHLNSERKYQPFVGVYCTGLSPVALEDEIFGRKTDADGQLELSQGGTLLLADVESLQSETQVKLLQILENREFTQTGHVRNLGLDTRLVTTTTANLRERVKSGEFREDLFYRLNVVPLFLPPLRERKEDIPPLINHFLNLFSPNQDIIITREAMDILLAYSWPSNIGELENAIERLVTMRTGQTISVGDIPIELKIPTPIALDDTSGGTSFHKIVQCTERELITWAMMKTKGNKTQSAKLLKMKPSTFRDALAKHSDEIELKS